MGKWGECSLFVEWKPRSDLASFFLSVPSEESFDGSILDIGPNYVEYGQPVLECENILPEQRAVEAGSYKVEFEGVQLSPLTFGNSTWTHSKNDLFMCKLQAHCYPSLAYKSNHQIAEKALSVEPLKEFIGTSEGKHIGLACGVCGNNLLAGEDNKDRKLSVGWVPSDDWMTLAPGGDYYCRETCGASCDPHKHGKHRDDVGNESINDDWKPTKLRIMISHTTLFVRKEIIKDAIKIDTNLVNCKQCDQHLGQRVKGNHKNILQLYHSNASLLCDRQKYLNMQYPERGIWFTHQLLVNYESTASQKLVIRTLDKQPILLVWILDSYVSIVLGKLESYNPEKKDFTNIVKPTPALKLLFKLFDSETAISDPRANGEDTSVGIVDLPLLACEDFKEALLRSSLSIPPPLRSLGQFYVAYFQFPSSFI